MSDVKQVKVDNWGIYFLQRLKHFFNRTDYCDLTLQFQDNAQLKVHRLVLSACTEYFELLERTCEMYEDCLVMPDDLQADVVVPIVNFMYTGHLEFRMDLLERLYQTSQILNMPVLTKLLESHRSLTPKVPAHSYSAVKRYQKQSEVKPAKSSTPASTSHKRSYSKAFENNVVYRSKKDYLPIVKTHNMDTVYNAASTPSVNSMASHKVSLADPRPTRYELPEELDTDNIFDNSFSNISYTSQPLVVHPETVKRYSTKRSGLFSEASSSKKMSGMSTVDIVECKRVTKEDNIFDDSVPEHNVSDDTEMFQTPFTETVNKDPNQLFDQILDHNDGPKVTIESKDSKAASNLDHARIISEVLKKYPHLVKSNKNIKLKILEPTPSKSKKQQKSSSAWIETKPVKPVKTEEEADYTYETDVIDSKQAAKLIAMGAENTKGPWICLICGTPGKALHFSSYYKFRRHLVEVHNEKPVSNICEYCGLRSLKRNYLLHHLYAQHGVPPPPQYNFPKCNQCSYIALTEGLLIKHKMTHKDIKNFRCNVCVSAFSSSSQLLTHIQYTGHKYTAEKKCNLQCIYCLRVFLRETNLYAHIKTHHKREAKSDGIIEDSDDEREPIEEKPKTKNIKFEPSTSYDNEYEDVELQFQIHQKPVVETTVAPPRKQYNTISNSKQKILNPGFGSSKPAQKAKPIKNTQPVHNDFAYDMKTSLPSNNQEEEIVVIDNNEYIMRDNQLIPRKRKPGNSDFVIADMVESATLHTVQQPTTSVQYTNVHNTRIDGNAQQQSSMIIKKTANINEPIEIVVSNEDEYKALMASNTPIIFDNGDANKTLTVLSAPHNSTLASTTLDLDNTRSNEMMIIPEEYPLNVTDSVSSENSNIVVVYSHPVDAQNKEFQILTTGGIGAQFVQPSAIITQNYETITTSTPVMTAHCIETQTWQNNVQSIGNQHIQLAPETEIQDARESNQVDIKPLHGKSVNNFDDLPEVHLVPESQKALPPQVGETDLIPSQLDVNLEHVDQPIQQVIIQEPQNTSEGHNMNLNVTCEGIIEKESTINEVNDSVITLPQNQIMPNVISNTGSISVVNEPVERENIIDQQVEPENIIERQIESEDGIEQQLESENVLDHQMESENMSEPQMESEDVIEQQMETENVLQQVESENVLQVESENILQQQMVPEGVIQQQMVPEGVIQQQMVPERVIQQQTESGNVIDQEMKELHVIEHPIESENLIEPIESEISKELQTGTENLTEQPIRTEAILEPPIVTENDPDQPMETENVILAKTHLLPKEGFPEENILSKTGNSEIPENNILDPQEDQQRETIQSQAYDDIVEISREINRANDVEPEYTKQAEEKIQNLTSEWSEDEYDVTEDDSSQNVENVANEVLQNQVMESEQPELEESIENIQQEVKKHMAAPIETDGDTVESVISSQASSQEMQLPPLNESPVHIAVPIQAQHKISSLLNDWEDNDSQEDIITVNTNVTEPTLEETSSNAPEDTEDASSCLPVTSKEMVQVPENDNIKSLVSDWDDDDEEAKD